MQKTS